MPCCAGMWMRCAAATARDEVGSPKPNLGSSGWTPSSGQISDRTLKEPHEPRSLLSGLLLVLLFQNLTLQALKSLLLCGSLCLQPPRSPGVVVQGPQDFLRPLQKPRDELGLQKDGGPGPGPGRPHGGSGSPDPLAVGCSACLAEGRYERA